MTKAELQKVEEIRFKEKDIRLSNQDIIEIGYMAKDLIEPLAASRQKLTFDQANCYSSVFGLVKHLLKEVNPEYLGFHEEVRDFYNQNLTKDRDRLELVDHGKGI